MHNSCLGGIRFKVKCVNELTQWLLDTGTYVLNVSVGYFRRFNVKIRKWCINYFQIEIYRYLVFFLNIFLARSIICELHRVAFVYINTRFKENVCPYKIYLLKYPFPPSARKTKNSPTYM